MFIVDKQGTYKAYHVLITTDNASFESTSKSNNFYGLEDNFDGYLTVLEAKDKIVNFKKIINGVETKPSLTARAPLTCVFYGWWIDNGVDISFQAIALVGCFSQDNDYPLNYGVSHGGGGGGAGSVKINPCDQLKSQNTNAAFKSKIVELANKTKLKNETGYAQKKDGTYQPLINSGGDQLNFANDATTIGFMHTHLDPYESGRYDSDGNPEIRSPIQMFSPADIKSFILLLVNANRNNIPLSDVYGTMVASNGVYQLRFEGSYSDINTGINFDGLNEIYLNSIRENKTESDFLKFLKNNIGINGLSLYKLKSDGTSEKKSLDTNNKLTTTPCQ